MVVGLMAAQYAATHKKKVGGLVAILIAMLALLIGGIVVGLGVRNDNRNMLLGGGITLGIGALALVAGSLMVRSANKTKSQASERWSGAQQPLLREPVRADQGGTSYASSAGSVSQAESPYQPLPESAFLDYPQQQTPPTQSSAEGQRESSGFTSGEIQDLVREAVQSPQAQAAIRARLPPQAQRKFDAAMLFANQDPQLVERAMRAGAALPTQRGQLQTSDMSQLVRDALRSPQAQQAIRSRMSPAMQQKFDSAVSLARQNPEAVRQGVAALESARARFLQRQRAA